MSEENTPAIDPAKGTALTAVPVPSNALSVDFMGLGVNKDDVVSIGVARLEGNLREREKQSKVKCSELESNVQKASKTFWDAAKKLCTTQLEQSVKDLSAQAEKSGIRLSFALDVSDISIDEKGSQKRSLRPDVTVNTIDSKGNVKETIGSGRGVIRITPDLVTKEKAVEAAQVALQKERDVLNGIQRKLSRMSVYERRIRAEMAAQHLANSSTGQELLDRIEGAVDRLADQE